MHEGEAVWKLAAALTFFERKYAADPAILKIVAEGMKSIITLAESTGVGMPNDEDLQRLVDCFECCYGQKTQGG